MSNDEPRILIVSSQLDIATDYVGRALSNRGANFVRINTEQFPLNTHSSFHIDKNNSPGWNWCDSSGVSTEINCVRAIWYRRHRLPRMPETIDEAHAEYCLRESEWFIKGSVFSFSRFGDVSWMSYPASIQMAESKIYQLTSAKSVGLEIADTLISNDPKRVRDFYKSKSGKIVAKPLRLGYFDYGNKQTSVYTNTIEWDHLQDDRSLAIAPVVFQELVPKRFDIRVTIVGNRVFAAAIHSQEIESARIDWRRTDTEDLEHSIHNLPADIEKKSLEYMRMLGLNYGALDFVLTPNNKYIFLEVNPNGQWVWLEDILGTPVSESIANWLIEHSTGSSKETG